MGTVLALPISGVISSDWGWEYAFYLFGSLTLVWLVFWAMLIRNSPGEHPTISEVILNVGCVSCRCVYLNSHLSNTISCESVHDGLGQSGSR